MRTQFFTGAGDEGKSALGGLPAQAGGKLSKGDLFFYALGSLDELNSWLGVCRAGIPEIKGDKLKINEILKNIQEILFIAQAELYGIKSGKGAGKKVSPASAEYLENIIRKIDEELPKLDKFVIPGGSELSARLDFARALSRNTERNVVKLSHEAEVEGDLLKYLNRLSSALFALARYTNFKFKIKEENPKYDE